jgi:hypothetical protein
MTARALAEAGIDAVNIARIVRTVLDSSARVDVQVKPARTRIEVP